MQYKVDNKVWLLTKNIKTKKLLKKLNYKMISLYTIKKLVRLSYQLKLFTSMKTHIIFHPGLLWKTFAKPLLGQYDDFILLVIVDNNKEE